ncbi:hypothetical protein E2C01_082925 [Portunus trituberculatus]|uniref:Uncharacterized protein n=1 Tax=Portunus trituberculatus TaxID=210409 RepID=A0A5B7J240_PORTR|nr:hypothetical protein [Portunus trituberculatus]
MKPVAKRGCCGVLLKTIIERVAGSGSSVINLSVLINKYRVKQCIERENSLNKDEKQIIIRVSPHTIPALEHNLHFVSCSPCLDSHAHSTRTTPRQPPFPTTMFFR